MTAAQAESATEPGRFVDRYPHEVPEGWYLWHGMAWRCITAPPRTADGRTHFVVESPLYTRRAERPADQLITVREPRARP